MLVFGMRDARARVVHAQAFRSGEHSASILLSGFHLLNNKVETYTDLYRIPELTRNTLVSVNIYVVDMRGARIPG